MSIPVTVLRYAGIWNAGSTYTYAMFVLSPIDDGAYVWTGPLPVIGGSDPSVPGSDWIFIPPTGTGDITGIIAGSGISGGGSAGNVTITNTGVLDLNNQSGSVTIVGDSVIGVSASGGTINLTATIPTEHASYISTLSQPIATSVIVPITYTASTIQTSNLSLIGPLPSSQILIGLSGVYEFAYSCQCDKAIGGSSSADIDIFISINGLAVPNSSSRTNITNAVSLVLTCVYVLTLNAGDILEVSAFTAGTNVSFPFIAAVGGIPAAPSVITNIVQIT